MHSNGAERFLPGSQNLTESRIQSRSERRSHATLETPDRAAGVLLQPYKYSECGEIMTAGFNLNHLHPAQLNLPYKRLS